MRDQDDTYIFKFCIYLGQNDFDRKKPIRGFAVILICKYDFLKVT